MLCSARHFPPPPLPRTHVCCPRWLSLGHGAAANVCAPHSPLPTISLCLSQRHSPALKSKWGGPQGPRWLFYIICVSSRPSMAVLYHMRVLKALDGCSISYACPQGPRWLFYIICVSSRPLMAGLYHMRVLKTLDGCSISYACPQGPQWLFYIICVSSRPSMAVLYHMRVLKALEAYGLPPPALRLCSLPTCLPPPAPLPPLRNPPTYYMCVLKALDAYSLSYLCPQGAQRRLAGHHEPFWGGALLGR